jgi:poly-gamma-glutamate capsule biosynthesis protein CapA/YwtB (metallophosphatase superfamily)
VKRLPLVVVLGLVALAIAVPVSGGLLGLGAAPPASHAPSEVAVASPGGTQAPSAEVASEAPEPTPTPTPVQPEPTPVFADIAIVPAAQFRSTRTATNREEVEEVLAGRSTHYEALELVEGDADAILAALDIQRPAESRHLILAKDAKTLKRHLAKNRKRLAIIRADEVTAGVRALAWGKRSLFGVDRVRDPGEWRLFAHLPDGDGDGHDDFDPATTWTMFAGGDVLLDRGVHQTISIRGKGEDFPFDGGFAEITGHTCCSGFGHPVPTMRRMGKAGAMRDLMKSSDLAIANFENPAPNTFRWHTSGTVFSADRRNLEGLVRAGLDYVSIANNHIGDAGRNGILQTIRNLDRVGLEHSGAGKDLKAARKPAILDVDGVKVAILGYDAIARYYNAAKGRPGNAPLSRKNVKEDVAAAREAGADVVIVFPHWGVEYRSRPFAAQQKLARQIIDAGADMVIGNHAHWAGAMEVYKGKPIWYALGNFVFDQTWSEPTMEGITLELTFRGSELVQAKMRPHIILDKAQPNFLDERGDGKIVMGQVYEASKGVLPW